MKEEGRHWVSTTERNAAAAGFFSAIILSLQCWLSF